MAISINSGAALSEMMDKEPKIYLEQNDWVPKKMVELLEFLKVIDKDPEEPPDFFKLAKKNGKLLDTLHRDDMRSIHLNIIAEEKANWLHQ